MVPTIFKLLVHILTGHLTMLAVFLKHVRVVIEFFHKNVEAYENKNWTQNPTLINMNS